MAHHTHGTRHSARQATRYAYAAFTWALVFTLMSFYWAAGGRLGLETLGEGFATSGFTSNPTLIAMTWITGILKLVAGVAALSLVQRWGERFPLRLRLFGVWLAGILFVLYAVGNAVQHILMLTGGMSIARTLGNAEAVRWHMFFWDPFWLVGGLLFIAAAYYARRSR